MNQGARTLLGFDYGTQRIGVAVGQEMTASSQPLKTLAAVGNKPDWQTIAALIQHWRPHALVVGIPLCMDDAEQEMTIAARRFARQLHGRFGLPVYEADERLSSREATELGYLMGRRPSRRRGQRTLPAVIDDLAAHVILQTFFSEPGACRRVSPGES